MRRERGGGVYGDCKSARKDSRRHSLPSLLGLKLTSTIYFESRAGLKANTYQSALRDWRMDWWMVGLRYINIMYKVHNTQQMNFVETDVGQMKFTSQLGQFPTANTSLNCHPISCFKALV